MRDNQDEHYMAIALELARAGLYSAAPNPRVGCVLVNHGVEIGRGYHRRTGAPHAEVEALTKADGDPRGATAYVSLEPCNHAGRTPPCTEALIDAGIARVVYAATDPNPSVIGRGAERLRNAGIEVLGGIQSDEAAALNRGFFSRMQDGRPFVRVKIAMSMDACVALENGESQWITGEQARADVHRLRAESCAIVTGIGTVLTDDPSLNVRDHRYELHGRHPRRVVLDDRLRMPVDARILSLAGETWIFHGEGEADKASSLSNKGARIEAIASHGGRIDIGGLLARLGELEINELMVEAGPTLTSAFITEGQFDELVIYVAPKLLGRSGRRALEVESPADLARARQFDLVSCEPIGDDVRWILRPERGRSGTKSNSD